MLSPLFRYRICRGARGSKRGGWLGDHPYEVTEYGAGESPLGRFRLQTPRRTSVIYFLFTGS